LDGIGERFSNSAAIDRASIKYTAYEDSIDEYVAMVVYDDIEADWIQEITNAWIDWNMEPFIPVAQEIYLCFGPINRIVDQRSKTRRYTEKDVEDALQRRLQQVLRPWELPATLEIKKIYFGEKCTTIFAYTMNTALRILCANPLAIPVRNHLGVEEKISVKYSMNLKFKSHAPVVMLNNFGNLGPSIAPKEYRWILNEKLRRLRENNETGFIGNILLIETPRTKQGWHLDTVYVYFSDNVSEIEEAVTALKKLSLKSNESELTVQGVSSFVKYVDTYKKS